MMGMTLRKKLAGLTAFICLLAFCPGVSAKPCVPGDKAKVQWKHNWYPATLLVRKDTRVCIHYDGWSSSWDECVALTRFKCMGNSAFKKGEQIEVKWKRKYLPAKITRLEGGLFCVRYLGAKAPADQCVGPRRIRQ